MGNVFVFVFIIKIALNGESVVQSAGGLCGGEGRLRGVWVEVSNGTGCRDLFQK